MRNAPAPPITPDVQASFDYCHRIARSCARNFYYGLKLTPEPKRSAVYAIYAFMRACDDLADGDEAAPTPSQERKARIESFRHTMDQVLRQGADGPLPDAPYWPAFRHVMCAYPVDPSYMHAMLNGQVDDLFKRRYADFNELYDYCYKVASVVGLVCISIWGFDGDAATRQLAEYRGVALQLTNILRDLAEDAARGRIYLPREDLERFNYTEDDLLGGVVNERFDRLMTYQIERAQSYYAMSATLEQHIDPDSRATCWAMMRIYRGLLDQIAANPRRVMTSRIRLSSFQKLGLALQATWKKSWA